MYGQQAVLNRIYMVCYDESPDVLPHSCFHCYVTWSKRQGEYLGVGRRDGCYSGR